MNEEARELQIALKDDVTRRLQGVRLTRYKLRAVDRRVETYVKGVIAAPDKHNVWEQLAVEKFFYMIDKYGIHTGPVKAFFKFYESLRFPSDTAGLQSYKLTPVQCFQFANIFGFWNNGRRVVREVCLYVPRKFSKTTSTASLAVWELLFGDANAECYIAANSYNQATKCFDVVRRCVLALDPGERRYIVNLGEIRAINPEHPAKAQCLTAGAKTKDGLNASLNIMDEYSQARDASLYNVLVTSMGARENPLTVIITTASDVYDGPFYNKLQGYKKILSGEMPDDSVFAHLFEPDLGDREDDPATWLKVHPHIGVTVEMDYYERQYEAARREGADAMLAFRTKLLNIYAQNEARAWITRKVAQACSAQVDLYSLDPMFDATIAIDLSKVDDLTAVTTALLDDQNGRMTMITDYYFPAGALDGNPNADLYRRWATDGYLHLIDGPTMDYDVIYRHIVRVAERYRIIKIGFDAYGSIDLANHLRAYGFEPIMFPIPQSHSYFDGPVNALEKRMKDGSITINDNPINLFCFANCVLVENDEGFKPFKRTQTAKIDGAITMLMAMRCFLYAGR